MPFQVYYGQCAVSKFSNGVRSSTSQYVECIDNGYSETYYYVQSNFVYVSIVHISDVWFVDDFNIEDDIDGYELARFLRDNDIPLSVDEIRENIERLDI